MKIEVLINGEKTEFIDKVAFDGEQKDEDMRLVVSLQEDDGISAGSYLYLDGVDQEKQYLLVLVEI